LGPTDLNKQEYSSEKGRTILIHLMNIAPDHENASSFQIILLGVGKTKCILLILALL
jgi:hypothetical protein